MCLQIARSPTSARLHAFYRRTSAMFEGSSLELAAHVVSPQAFF